MRVRAQFTKPRLTGGILVIGVMIVERERVHPLDSPPQAIAGFSKEGAGAARALVAAAGLAEDRPNTRPATGIVAHPAA